MVHHPNLNSSIAHRAPEASPHHHDFPTTLLHCCRRWVNVQTGNRFFCCFWWLPVSSAARLTITSHQPNEHVRFVKNPPTSATAVPSSCTCLASSEVPAEADAFVDRYLLSTLLRRPLHSAPDLGCRLCFALIPQRWTAPWHSGRKHTTRCWFGRLTLTG